MSIGRFAPKTRALVVLGIAAMWCATAGIARAEDRPPSVRWSLSDVIATALARHPAIGQADAEIRAAVARRGQAASGLYPQVGGQGGWTLAESPTATGVDMETSTGLVQATASHVITDFGRTRAGVSRADALASAAQQGGMTSRVEVGYAVAVGYFNVLRAENVRAVSRQTMRQRETLLKQARSFYETGLKARIDVVRAEAGLLQAQAALADADFDVETARLSLLSRMGVDGPRDFELADAPQGLPAAGSMETWQREADENHPDLKALRLQVAAARSALDAARLGNAPTLSASGRYGFTGGDLPIDETWSLGAQVSISIFSGGLVRQQVAEADARLSSATFVVEDRRRQIRLQVQQAAQAVTSAEERVRVREKEREAFAENLRLATGRYEAGAGDIIEMTDAQVQMVQAENNLAGARFDRAVAVAALDRALGRLPRP